MWLSWNLLLRAYTYDTLRICTFLHIQEIITPERYIKRWRMLCITKTPGENYGFEQNPDSSSGIYMTS